jgi:4,5-DOPA dioxygenase extradiol
LNCDLTFLTDGVEMKSSTVQPAAFISHGSPMTVLETGPYARSLAEFGRSVAPLAIVVISAHWEEPGIQIAAGAHPPLIYDFSGFPKELYKITYDAPGSPSLAAEVAGRLKQAGFAAGLDGRRGWDHGVWVPLRLMFPDAQIPVVEISLPTQWSPRKLYNVGQALAAFRQEGVLVMGSGGIVHNLRLMNFRQKDTPVDAWASEFQEWVKEGIEKEDLEKLFAYEKEAPNAARAVPTPEHFAPLFPVLGAARQSARLVPIFEGIEYGNMSMFSFQLVD